MCSAGYRHVLVAWVHAVCLCKMMILDRMAQASFLTWPVRTDVMNDSHCLLYKETACWQILPLVSSLTSVAV